MNLTDVLAPILGAAMIIFVFAYIVWAEHQEHK